VPFLSYALICATSSFSHEPLFPLQRRRWLNGSFFAGVYALSHTLQIFGTQHSKKKKVFLLGQVVYNFVNVLFAWLGLSCVSNLHFLLSKRFLTVLSFDLFEQFLLDLLHGWSFIPSSGRTE
jgi:cellulose synthase/poly-beta-1,6-N-acetylglucosamine synthase-like glycosyltransferase